MADFQKTQHQGQQLKAVKTNKTDLRGRKKTNLEQIQEAPETLHPDDVLAAQQQYGNQVVQRALDDKDRGRKRLTDEQGYLRDDMSDSIQKARQGGTPLDRNLQEQAKETLGKKFDNVRIHTDEKADEFSRAMNARAFTIGNDIFFKNGVFAPETSKGRETLIHELTHVIQQGGDKRARGKLKLGGRSTPQEQEADHLGKKSAQGTGKVTPTANGSSLVQKIGDEEELPIQGQEDEEELQMQEEEDELQMQEDEDELQMQEDEDELQMQEDEDEIQTQPESSGVVQRLFGRKETEEEKKKKSEEEQRQKYKSHRETMLTSQISDPHISSDVAKRHEAELRKFHKKKIGFNPARGAMKKRSENIFSISKEKMVDPKTSSKQAGAELEKLRALPSRGIFKKSYANQALKDRKKTLTKQAESGDLSAIGKLGEEEETSKASAKAKQEAEKNAKDPGRKYRKQLEAKIKDPKSSTEDAQEAEKQLRALYKRTGRSNYAEAAWKERRNNMRELAQSGDADAVKKFSAKGEKKETKMEKVKRFGSWVGEKASPLIGMIKGFAGGKAKEAKEHFMGKSEEKETEKDAKGGGNGGGGGGGGGVASMIAELYQENKQLKDKIKELEKAKPTV